DSGCVPCRARLGVHDKRATERVDGLVVVSAFSRVLTEVLQGDGLRQWSPDALEESRCFGDAASVPVQDAGSMRCDRDDGADPGIAFGAAISFGARCLGELPVADLNREGDKSRFV